DPRFASPLLTEEQKAELFPMIGDALRAKTTAEWCDALRAAAIRYAPVRDYAAVAADPQVWENGYLRTVDDGSGGDVHVVGSPITLSDHPAMLGGMVPELGQHTEEVLLELGYSWDDISELRDAGAF
ncbi:MAG TPA: CoA transferase, partial [Acidimicrobiales bacterium]|nr:CoA transferase [Acidimicrobiales bacterium]